MAKERIEGIVTDENKQGLPGVTLILTKEKDKTVKEEITREDGRFVFSGLIPGGYMLKAQMNNFKTSKQQITLGVDEALELYITLQSDHGRY
jgi:hypothetical protein